jgi:nucleoside-diphosphate-sugar epimerase
MPFETPPPYVPVDEEYPGRPESAYSLSKLLGEEMAKQFCRWDPEMKIIGLRFSNVMEPHDYAVFRTSSATRMPASGTYGVTSTRAMLRKRSEERSKRPSRARKCLSSPTPTLS